MSSSAYSTPPSRRPPLRHTSASSLQNSPVRSFSMPTPFQTNSTRSSPSPSSSRRGSWDCEKSVMDEKEVFMGALVSPGGGYDCEKSIDVPCIILTEPDHYNHRPTPIRPKQILLLPPTSLPLPLHSNASSGQQKGGWNIICRAALLVAVVGLGGWHIWGILGGIESEGL